jgi:hypothetical protein
MTTATHPDTVETARTTPPTEATDRGHGLSFVVWADRPYYLEDSEPWKAIAAFRYLLCALDFIASCQDIGQPVVFQSPTGCQTYQPTDRRAVAK